MTTDRTPAQGFESLARAFPAAALLEGAGTIPGLLAKLQTVRQRVLSGRPPGVPTGLRLFDERAGGLQTGVHLLAAPPGAGKTTLALQIARAAAQTGASVVFLAFDEGGDRLALKLAAGLAGLRATDYLKGAADPADIEKAVDAHRDLLARLRIYAGPVIGPADCGAMLLEAMQIDGADEGLLIVDYVQSWAARLDAGGDFRQAVSLLVGGLRQVAMQTGQPVLAIAAQNRAGQGEAQLSSLRESSDLEYTADTIAFLTGDEESGDQPRRKMTLACRKNRWGPTFDVPLTFHAEHGLFVEDRRPLR